VLREPKFFRTPWRNRYLSRTWSSKGDSDAVNYIENSPPQSIYSTVDAMMARLSQAFRSLEEITDEIQLYEYVEGFNYLQALTLFASLKSDLQLRAIAIFQQLVETSRNGQPLRKFSRAPSRKRRTSHTDSSRWDATQQHPTSIPLNITFTRSRHTHWGSRTATPRGWIKSNYKVEQQSPLCLP